MVILVERFRRSGKFSSKLENRTHQSEALSASLQSFQSNISNCLNHVSKISEAVSEFFSLEWIQQCFEVAPISNRAFAKLVVDIDYPVTEWGASSVEDYLNYSLNLLYFLNSISSAIYCLAEARLSLSHAVVLLEKSPFLAVERLRKIQPKKHTRDLKVGLIEESKEKPCSGKEWVIQQALVILKNLAFWVCGIVLLGLCSDPKPYLEMRKTASFLVHSWLKALDSSVYKEISEEKGVVNEVKEVNDAVDRLVSALGKGKGDDDAAAKELQRRLEKLEMMIKSIEKEANLLFSVVMIERNKLLDTLRQQK